MGWDGRYIPSPGSPGFYANQSTAAVTFDQHSLMLDGKRIMVFRYILHHALDVVIMIVE